MVWDDSYALGVEQIDRQHRALFTAVNRVSSVLEQEDSQRNRRICMEAVKYLKNYTLQHFADEEAYQRSVGYSGLEQHKRQHESLIEAVGYMEKELEETNYAPASVKRLEGVLTSWLLYHVMNADQAIVGRVARIEGCDDSIAHAVEAVFIQAAQQVFRVSAEVSDRNYVGGFSGSELFSIFDIETGAADGPAYRFVFAMEELLALRMIGGLAGRSVRAVDEMVVSALQQLFGDMAVRSLALYGQGGGRIIRRRVLRHAEAKSYFIKEQPLCRLLFSSELGPSVVCGWTI